MNNELSIECLTLGVYGVNTYIVGDKNEVMIIDAGFSQNDLPTIDESIGSRKLARIVYTHGHFDHIEGADFAREHYKGVSHYIHEKDDIMFTSAKENLSAYFGVGEVRHKADFTFKDGETFNVGSLKFTVMHTPGHCPGAVCYFTEGHLFTGDTLFAMGVGRTDFPHGDAILLSESLEKIFTYHLDTLFYPGHESYGGTLEQRKKMGI